MPISGSEDGGDGTLLPVSVIRAFAGYRPARGWPGGRRSQTEGFFGFVGSGFGSGDGGCFKSTPVFPMNSIPDSSRARCMAARLFRIGSDAPRSKLRMLVTDTPEAAASCSWDQLSRARAARDWAGFMLSI